MKKLILIIIFGWLIYLTNSVNLMSKVTEGTIKNVDGLIETDSLIIEYLQNEKNNK